MSLNSEQNNGQLAFLSENASFTFAHTKAERLATAVYMVTRFMPENEPLRMTLRSESIGLLSRIFMLEARGGADTVLSAISEIVSLLDIGYRTQYISEMNWSVIRNEYLSFKSFIAERGAGSILDSGTINKDFFSLQEPQVMERPSSVPSAPVRRAQPAVKDRTISKGQRSIAPKTPAKRRTPTKSPVIQERKHDRRETILKLVKERKKVTVRDVAEVISGVSEKTLQRELISLVDEKVLRKEGERRWSTYFLA